MSKLTPQALKVLDYMVARGSISQLEAESEFKVKRLASRIYDLSAFGIPIERVMVKSFTGQRYAKYSIGHGFDPNSI